MFPRIHSEQQQRLCGSFSKVSSSSINILHATDLTRSDELHNSNKLEQPKIGYVQEGEGRGARAGVRPAADAIRSIETVSYWLVGVVTSVFIFVGGVVLIKVKQSFP